MAKFGSGVDRFKVEAYGDVDRVRVEHAYTSAK